MRHNKKINHLGRTASHRASMLANMAVSLIKHKRITTTVEKAKALKKYVEPLLTKSKNDTTNSRRVERSSALLSSVITSEGTHFTGSRICALASIGRMRSTAATARLISMSFFFIVPILLHIVVSKKHPDFSRRNTDFFFLHLARFLEQNCFCSSSVVTRQSLSKLYFALATPSVLEDFLFLFHIPISFLQRRSFFISTPSSVQCNR